MREQQSEILEKKIRGIMLALKLRRKTLREIAYEISKLFSRLKKEDEPKCEKLIKQYRELVEELFEHKHKPLKP